MISEELINFYSKICACKNDKCKVVNENGCPPRGFYTRTVGPVDIMAVCKNPGHPFDTERSLYKDENSEDIANNHLEMAGFIFNGINRESTKHHFTSGNFAGRRTVFHRNLLHYMSFFLDIEEVDVFNRIVYTNLVKCSTEGKQDRLNEETIDECKTHLGNEIKYFRPKVLVAFSREVEQALNLQGHELDGKVLPVIYVRHPSYHYRRDEKDGILAEIKKEIKNKL